MKRNLFISGGQPTLNRDFENLHDELYAAIQGGYAGVGAMVLSGCDIDFVAGTISAGVVFINNLIMRLPAASGLSFPCYIEQAPDTQTEQRTFTDGNTNYVYNLIQAKVVSSQPASGEFIEIELNKPPQAVADFLKNGQREKPLLAFWDFGSKNSNAGNFSSNGKFKFDTYQQDIEGILDSNNEVITIARTGVYEIEYEVQMNTISGASNSDVYNYYMFLDEGNNQFTSRYGMYAEIGRLHQGISQVYRGSIKRMCQITAGQTFTAGVLQIGGQTLHPHYAGIKIQKID